MNNIPEQRLVAQHAAQADLEWPEDVVRHMLAMQAQDYNGALWSVALRTKNATLQDVEQAIKDRKIVRTWPMRGTLHFLHADDVHWMVQLLAPRVTASVKSRRINQLGLTDAIVAEAEAVFRAELNGGKSIVRNEVTPLLARKVKGLAITNQHAQHLMRNFGERGIICFGPHAGKQPTFVLLDEWITKPPAKSREAALQELAVRYFKSHGPATLKDFAGWGMLTMTDARKALESVLPELEAVVVSDTTYYRERDLLPIKGRRAYLLPGFDEYMLGYKDRDAALPMEHANKIVPGNNGMFLPTMVLDGQVVGTWKRTIKKTGIDFQFSAFTKLSAKDLQLFEPAKQQYRAFYSVN